MNSSSSRSESVLTPKLLLFLLLVIVVAGVVARILRQGEPERLSAAGADGASKIPSTIRDLEPAANQLVILGLDGASWSQVLPLIESGRLPTLARIMQHGSYGHLQTLLPTVSPTIWTSVVTGKRPEKHGITDFTVWDEEREKQVPATGEARKTLALWNLLDYYRIPAGVVNWWTTWPAEPVEGFILTDLAAMGRRKQLEERTRWAAQGQENENTVGIYYPPDLQTVEQGMAWSGVRVADLLSFARLSEMDQERLDAIDTFQTGNPLSVLKFSYLGDRYYSDMTLGALSRFGLPDLLLYYTSSTDALPHTLWKYSHPAEGFPAVDPELEKRYERTLDLHYEWMDGRLGRILSHYPKNVNVIVLSDHGMIGMPDVTGGVKDIISARHTDHAFVMVSGRDFRENKVFATRRIEGENFERWENSINYQELGFRNLFPGGWMETVVVTPEGDTELGAQFKVDAGGPATLAVSWDGKGIGTLTDKSPLRFSADRGAHRLRLEHPGEEQELPELHPPSIPWVASHLASERPRHIQSGEDWGYLLWQEGDVWHLRWTAYQGRLFEINPVFSGTLTCERGFDRWRAMTPPTEGKIGIAGNMLSFEHCLSGGSGEAGVDFVPEGPVSFDLLIDGARYPRMVYLRSVSRLKVDAITLKTDGREETPVPGILDITPTALALFGLPVADDMDGRVWKEHLSREALERLGPLKVSTYEGLPAEIRRPRVLPGEEIDQDRLDYLRALGYISSASSR